MTETHGKAHVMEFFPLLKSLFLSPNNRLKYFIVNNMSHKMMPRTWKLSVDSRSARVSPLAYRRKNLGGYLEVSRFAPPLAVETSGLPQRLPWPPCPLLWLSIIRLSVFSRLFSVVARHFLMVTTQYLLTRMKVYSLTDKGIDNSARWLCTPEAR
jgi:hypothetical protein